MDPTSFVFIDETGATTNMIRRYGWGPRGERLVDTAPHGHWKTTTFVAGLRATGNAVANNLLGRLGMVLSGFAVGSLSVGLAGSVGNAVALLALAPLAAVPLVLGFVPETRGRPLEETAEA